MKRIVKNMIGYITSLVILVHTLIFPYPFGYNQSIYAADANALGIDMRAYLADILTSPENPQYNIWRNLVYNTSSPSRTMVNIIEETPLFAESVLAWEAETIIFDPGSGLDEIVFDKEDYYKAVVYQMLGCMYNADDTGMSALSDAMKCDSAQMMRDLMDGISEDNIDLKNLSAEDRQKITVMLKETGEKYDIIDDAFFYIDTVLDSYAAIENTVNELVRMSCAMRIDESQRTVLLSMYNNCDHQTLKQVIYDIYLISLNNKESSWKMFSEIAEDSTLDFLCKVVDITKDIVAEAIGIGPLLICEKLTKGLTNLIFSTDKIIEQYHCMNALVQVELCLTDSISEFSSAYVNSGSSEDAHSFLAALNMYFEVFELSCEYATDYATVVYNGGLAGKIAYLLDPSNCNAYIEHVANIQTNANLIENHIFSCYIYYLEVDYPEFYSQFGFNSEEYIPVTGVEFYSESAEYGLEDMFFEPTVMVYPENATSPGVIFSSSDESVIIVDGNILEMVGTGTAVITATTVDGNYSAQQTVTVVEGCGTDGNKANYVPDGELDIENGDILYSGNYEFTVIDAENRYVSVSSYQGDDTYISVPKYIFCSNAMLTITEIGDNVFESLYYVESINLPNSITHIGNGAFSDCNSLSAISIPNNVNNIGDGAFWNCNSLYSIHLPDTVVYVGESAFKDCNSISSINIPDNVTYIGACAFLGCSSLSSVAIPEGITTIYGSTFEWCTDLTDVSLPDSVTELGSGAFYKCTSLTSIDLPESLTVIGSGAFYECTSLASIDLPESLTVIGSEAFENCTSLTSIYLPDSVTELNESSFSGCTSLEYFRFGKEMASLVDDNVFYYCDNLKTISIANNNTRMYIYNMPWVETVYIEEGVTAIEDWAFYETQSELKSIYLPSTLETIGYSAFDGCGNLKSINIPDNVTYIGGCAFSGCSSLSSITIPEGITTIYDSTFEGCTNLTDVSLPDSVTAIEVGAFNGCTSLASIDLPESLTVIGSRAFANCTALTSVYLPDSVTTLGERAFSGCTSLEYFRFGKEMASLVNNNVFYYCDNLKTISIANNNTRMYIYNMPWVETVYIEEGVTAIEDWAFYETQSELKSIYLPSTLETIGYSAFDGCSNLESITILQNVTTISDFAFGNCAEDFTIYGYTNTRAEEYATENGITFIDLSDVNTDDVASLQKWILAVPDVQVSNCESDLTGNGTLNVIDLCIMKRNMIQD